MPEITLEEFNRRYEDDPRWERVKTENDWPLWRTTDPALIAESERRLAESKTSGE